MLACGRRRGGVAAAVREGAGGDAGGGGGGGWMQRRREYRGVERRLGLRTCGVEIVSPTAQQWLWVEMVEKHDRPAHLAVCGSDQLEVFRDPLRMTLLGQAERVGQQ